MAGMAKASAKQLVPKQVTWPRMAGVTTMDRREPRLMAK